MSFNTIGLFPHVLGPTPSAQSDKNLSPGATGWKRPHSTQPAAQGASVLSAKGTPGDCARTAEHLRSRAQPGGLQPGAPSPSLGESTRRLQCTEPGLLRAENRLAPSPGPRSWAVGGTRSNRGSVAQEAPAAGAHSVCFSVEVRARKPRLQEGPVSTNEGGVGTTTWATDPGLRAAQA